MPVPVFAKEDIPQVAGLYLTVLRERPGTSPIEPQSSIHEIYFKNPWIEGPQQGKDHEIPWCSASENFVRGAEESGRFVPFADLYVRRTGPFADGFGERSVLRAAGAPWLQHDPGSSVHWMRVLRPARFATFALSHMAANGVVTSMALAARRFCGVVDRPAGSLSFSPFRQSESSLQITELDVETLLTCQEEFRNGHSLWPEYDANSLSWLLNFMARMKEHGSELRKVVPRDQTKKIAGWYIYSVTPGGVREVIQIGVDRRNTKSILDHLFHDALDHDVIALRGIVDRHSMPDFPEKNCFFTCRGGWMVAHSWKLAFLGTLSEGDAFLSRLDGEWCLAFGT